MSTETAKLRVKEMEILKKEEETLRKLIHKYKNSLNALKVEELTINNQLGTTQDRARLSRNNTPTGISQPTLPLSSSNLTKDAIERDVSSDNTEKVNKSTLNLSAVPLMGNVLEENESYEEEEDDDLH